MQIVKDLMFSHQGFVRFRTLICVQETEALPTPESTGQRSSALAGDACGVTLARYRPAAPSGWRRTGGLAMARRVTVATASTSAAPRSAL
jgi:hypothetical protein